MSDPDAPSTAPDDKQLRIRCDPQTRQAIEEAARLSGLTLSAWARATLREAAENRLRSAGKTPGWVQ